MFVPATGLDKHESNQPGLIVMVPAHTDGVCPRFRIHAYCSQRGGWVEYKNQRSDQTKGEIVKPAY